MNLFGFSILSALILPFAASAACPNLSGVYRGDWKKADGSIYATTTITLRQTGCETVLSREFFGEGDVSIETYKLGEVVYEQVGAETTNSVVASYLHDQFLVTGISFDTVTKKLNTLQNVSYRLASDGSLVGEEVSTRDLPLIKGQVKLTYLGKKIGN